MLTRRAFATLKNSKTHANLKAAFAGESQANRRYLYFAQKAVRCFVVVFLPLLIEPQ